MTQSTTTSLPTGPAKRRITVKAVITSLRLFALPISVLTVPMVTAAILPVGRWHWGILLATTACVACLHLAGNLLNDYFDFLGEVDRDIPDDDARPGRVLVRGQLLPRDILIEAWICLLLAGMFGAFLVSQRGPMLLWFALAGVAGLYAYTGPPFKLKSHALGELTMVWAFGPPLGLAIAFAQTGQFELRAIWVSLVSGLATACTLSGNNYRDRVEDGQAGIKTIAQFADGRIARNVYFSLAIVSVSIPVILAMVGQGPLILLGAPLTLLLLRYTFASMMQCRRLADIDVRTARFEAVLLLFMLLAYMLWPRS
jgi:1,4-dihydroxy-2-naphthoate octaprenyltransferase